MGAPSALWPQVDCAAPDVARGFAFFAAGRNAQMPAAKRDRKPA
jgi:hypothetical protein